MVSMIHIHLVLIFRILLTRINLFKLIHSFSIISFSYGCFDEFFGVFFRNLTVIGANATVCGDGGVGAKGFGISVSTIFLLYVCFIELLGLVLLHVAPGGCFVNNFKSGPQMIIILPCDIKLLNIKSKHALFHKIPTLPLVFNFSLMG